MCGGGAAEVEDPSKGSLGEGQGQKNEPTGLKGVLRIRAEERWAGDGEKIRLRAMTDSLHQDGAERPYLNGRGQGWLEITLEE